MRLSFRRVKITKLFVEEYDRQTIDERTNFFKIWQNYTRQFNLLVREFCTPAAKLNAATRNAVAFALKIFKKPMISSAMPGE